MLEMDTRGILFICGGAFTGLEKIIEKRSDGNSIGFHGKVNSKEKSVVNFHEVTTKDLITYGLIPEFIGRFGLITSVDELTEQQLIEILKEPKNSLIKQYQYMFELDGVDLFFEEDAYNAIAKKAKEVQTNARGLKNILEKTLLPYQFESINLVERGLKIIRISKDAVEGKPATLIFDKVKNEKLQ
jgi:ATP-dependent Clp protease ATP-binding subunit ClpX